MLEKIDPAHPSQTYIATYQTLAMVLSPWASYVLFERQLFEYLKLQLPSDAQPGAFAFGRQGKQPKGGARFSRSAPCPHNQANGQHPTQQQRHARTQGHTTCAFKQKIRQLFEIHFLLVWRVTCLVVFTQLMCPCTFLYCLTNTSNSTSHCLYINASYFINYTTQFGLHT